MLIQTIHQPSAPGGTGSLTVRMWSTKVWDIESVTSGQYDFTSPDTRYGSGEDCVPNEGYGGFDVDVWRYFRKFGIDTQVLACGTLLTGGRGTIVGTVVGVLIFATLGNVFTLNNLDGKPVTLSRHTAQGTVVLVVLRGGDAGVNAAVFRRVLAGERGPVRDARHRERRRTLRPRLFADRRGALRLRPRRRRQMDSGDCS